MMIRSTMLSKKLWLVGFFLVAFVALGFSQTINVATFNIRNDNNRQDKAQGDGWERRLPVISNLIRFHQFDIVGTQEGLYHQLTGMRDQLPGFAFTGKGRDDGKEAGEFAAIFYDTRKFDLLDEGDFWLSEDTSKPNKGWDAALPRICSWAKLRVKESGKTLYFFNVHFDHVGVKAREESSKLILRKITEMAGNHTTILTGDFNVDQNSASYKVLNDSEILQDSYEMAEVTYALNGTFSGFDPNSMTESRIDHIFLTSDFNVSRYGVLTDSYRTQLTEEERASGNFPKEVKLKDYRARLPSDHFPVMATIRFQ